MYPFIGYSVRVSSKIDKEYEEHWKGRWNEERRIDDSLESRRLCLSHIEREREREEKSLRQRDTVFVFSQFGHVSVMQNFYTLISFK